jgi:hypothetical protein
MAKVTWFEAYETHFGYDASILESTRSNNFLDCIMLIGDRSTHITYEGKIYVVTVDTDLDGIPHSTLMCGFSTFRTEQMFGQVDMTERMANFIDELCTDSVQTIYDSFTWDDDFHKFVLITHSDYDYKGDE